MRSHTRSLIPLPTLAKHAEGAHIDRCRTESHVRRSAQSQALLRGRSSFRSHEPSGEIQYRDDRNRLPPPPFTPLGPTPLIDQLAMFYRFGLPLFYRSQNAVWFFV